MKNTTSAKKESKTKETGYDYRKRILAKLDKQIHEKNEAIFSMISSSVMFHQLQKERPHIDFTEQIQTSIRGLALSKQMEFELKELRRICELANNRGQADPFFQTEFKVFREMYPGSYLCSEEIFKCDHRYFDSKK